MRIERGEHDLHAQCALAVDAEKEMCESLEEGEGAIPRLSALVVLESSDLLDDERETVGVQPDVVCRRETLGDGELGTTDDSRLDEHATERDEALV